MLVLSSTKTHCRIVPIQGRHIAFVPRLLGHRTERNTSRLQAVAGQPKTAAEVVSWAKQQFLQEVGKPDGSISLAKAALLIALEEEAAAQLEKVGAPNRTGATASTWSLQRLDALAAEVIDVLLQQGQIVPELSADGPDAADSTNSSCSQKQLHDQVKALAEQYPMQVLLAVNSVLFGRHGYSACNRYGTPSDSQLASVLESGPGSCAALTVLYIEVCSRLGLQLGFKVVEEGRYCLAWPAPHRSPLEQGHHQQQQQQQLTAGGEACVLDVYGKGALLTLQEATELFSLTADDLLAGSSRRELLAALLAEQQHSHWCAAIGCSPQPLFMTQLSAATALKHQVRQLNGLSIERATAAAEKRVALLPGDLTVQLSLALLCYFSGRYEDAWLELGSYIEAYRQLSAPSMNNRPTGAAPAAGTVAHPDPVAAANAAASSIAAGASTAAAVHAGASGAVAASVATVEASTDNEEGTVEDTKGAAELADVLLLFEKLQLELMMQSVRADTD